MSKQLANSIYSGSASVGRIFTDIKVVIVIIIAIPFIIWGISLVLHKTRKILTVNGIISNKNYRCIPFLEKSCTYDRNSNIQYETCSTTQSYKCSFVVDYKLKDSSSSSQIKIDTINNNFYSVDQEVLLYYDPENPEKSISLEQDNYKAAGWIIIIISIVVLISTLLFALLVHKYKPIAALVGAKEGIELITNKL